MEKYGQEGRFIFGAEEAIMKSSTYKTIMAVAALILLFGVVVGEANTNLVTNLPMRVLG